MNWVSPRSIYRSTFQGEQLTVRDPRYKAIPSNVLKVPGMIERKHPHVISEPKQTKYLKALVSSPGVFDSKVDTHLYLNPKAIANRVPPEQHKFSVREPKPLKSYHTKFDYSHYLPDGKPLKIKPSDDWCTKLGLTRKEAEKLASDFSWESVYRHEQEAPWALTPNFITPQPLPPNTTFEQNADMVRARQKKDTLRAEENEKTYAEWGRRQQYLPTNYTRWMAPIAPGQKPNPPVAEQFDETKYRPDKHRRFKINPETGKITKSLVPLEDCPNVPQVCFPGSEEYKQFHQLLNSKYVSHPHRKPTRDYGGYTPTAAPMIPLFREPKTETEYQTVHRALPEPCYQEERRTRPCLMSKDEKNYPRKKSLHQFEPRWVKVV